MLSESCGWYISGWGLTMQSLGLSLSLLLLVDSNGGALIVCFFICCFQFRTLDFGLDRILNSLPSPVEFWIAGRQPLVCFARFEALQKPLLHPWQIYGLSPVWSLTCTLRALDSTNARSQCGHLWRLSLLCIFMWRIRLLGWEKLATHWSHINGVSPVCERLWCAKSAANI